MANTQFHKRQVRENSSIPKYRQIIDQILKDISKNKLQIGDKLPSITRMSKQLKVSRDTVEKSYTILKKQKTIIPIRGKGFYISANKVDIRPSILFLINKLSSYKMAIYNAFVATIGERYQTDFHIYHCDDNLFLNLLNMYKTSYDYFVIMPHFKTLESKHINFTPKAIAAINQIPKDKLIIMDNNELEVDGDIIEIFQDFENDIYHTLNEIGPTINNYDRLFLMVPEQVLYPSPIKILQGFEKFCREENIEFEILKGSHENRTFKKKDLYIVIEEIDLVKLLNQIQEVQLRLKKDVGVISFNDTPLKQLLNISVISTDFEKMGETAARMILNSKKGKVKNPFGYIGRGSV